MRFLMNKIYVSLLDGLLVFRIVLYYYKITAKMLMQIYKHFFYTKWEWRMVIIIYYIVYSLITFVIIFLNLLNKHLNTNKWYIIVTVNNLYFPLKTVFERRLFRLKCQSSVFCIRGIKCISNSI